MFKSIIVTDAHTGRKMLVNLAQLATITQTGNAENPQAELVVIGDSRQFITREKFVSIVTVLTYLPEHEEDSVLDITTIENA